MDQDSLYPHVEPVSRSGGRHFETQRPLGEEFERALEKYFNRGWIRMRVRASHALAQHLVNQNCAPLRRPRPARLRTDRSRGLFQEDLRGLDEPVQTERPQILLTLRVELGITQDQRLGCARGCQFEEELFFLIPFGCRRQAQPDDGEECRTGYAIEEHGVTLFDEEPDWTGHGRLRRRPVAHLALARTRSDWMLWWMSDDMACIYPVLGGSDLASLVAIVEEDEHGVFTN